MEVPWFELRVPSLRDLARILGSYYLGFVLNLFLVCIRDLGASGVRGFKASALTLGFSRRGMCPPGWLKV